MVSPRFFFARPAGVIASLICGAGLMAATVTTPRVAYAQPMRAADPASIGQTVHFTLDKDEQKDLAITLPGGKYFITVDMKRADDDDSNMSAQIDLLKTNGSVVENAIFGSHRISAGYRDGRTFTVEKPYTAAKPLAARLRVKSGYAQEFWITVQPVARRTFIPFGFAGGDLKPMAIGTDNGKGGTLDKYEWAYHKITLQPGKYNVSLYLKQPDGKSDNFSGEVTMLDQYGVENENPALRLFMHGIDVEKREETKLLLLKPQTVIFRVMNKKGAPEEYTLGIEKDTD